MLWHSITLFDIQAEHEVLKKCMFHFLLYFINIKTAQFKWLWYGWVNNGSSVLEQNIRHSYCFSTTLIGKFKLIEKKFIVLLRFMYTMEHFMLWHLTTLFDIQAEHEV